MFIKINFESFQLKVLIQIVRKHVKFFKYSPVRNDDFLQPEMLNYYSKFKKLSLDNKTRWTSLKRMLKDFLDHYLAIEHALKMAGKPFLLTETDIEKLRSLANILTIFELAVNNSSKRNATLIDLEKIFKFRTTKLTAIGSYC